MATRHRLGGHLPRPVGSATATSKDRAKPTDTISGSFPEAFGNPRSTGSDPTINLLEAVASRSHKVEDASTKLGTECESWAMELARHVGAGSGFDSTPWTDTGR